MKKFLVFVKDPKEEIRRKQQYNHLNHFLEYDVVFSIPSATSNYIQKNPWVHLMISKRLDGAIDEVKHFFHSIPSPLSLSSLVLWFMSS